MQYRHRVRDHRVEHRELLTVCAAGTIAIGEAMRYIQRGEAEVMLAGGVEAPIAPLSFGAFSVIRAMSKRNHDPERASRPFDRVGMVSSWGRGRPFWS